MKIIIISSPDFFPGEINAINRLFQDGMGNLHLRKPDCQREDLHKLIESIDPEYYSRIALHQHHDLAAGFGIAGLHFPETYRKATSEDCLQDLTAKGYRLSTSIHDLAELENLSNAFSYTFFGPVFNSISKEGYAGIVGDDLYLEDDLKKVQVIAIGGINEQNIKTIQKMNFDGAALLGAIWQKNQSNLLETGGLSSRQLIHAGLRRLEFVPTGQSPKKSIAAGHSRRIQIDRKLQFISNENDGMSHIESIMVALEAGCKWIQLRVKAQTEAHVLELAKEAKSLCDSFDSKLIINDFPLVAKTVDAYGLHLGLDDMPLREARKIVGNEMIIGGTANTLEHVIQRIEEGADYVGLGPYRFTTTKQNLSPILGLEGFERILESLAAQNLSVPIVAIGGIQTGDIAGLMAAGVHCVAMSSALTRSVNSRETVLEIEKLLC